MSSLKFLSAVEQRPRVVNEAIRKLQEATARDPIINVKDYGAKGDGTTDDTTAIENAIAAVPAAGGVVYFPAGVYMVDPDTLIIGNGSNAANSTTHGIALIGDACTAQTLTKGTVIKARAAGTTLLEIKGAIHGVRVENITFDCDGVVANGLYIYSANNSVFRNFAIWDFTTYGFRATTRTGPGGTVAWAAQNVIENFLITSSSVVDSGAGMLIDGSYADSLDWHHHPNQQRHRGRHHLPATAVHRQQYVYRSGLLADG
jgi:polygalacturonase